MRHCKVQNGTVIYSPMYLPPLRVQLHKLVGKLVGIFHNKELEGYNYGNCMV